MGILSLGSPLNTPIASGWQSQKSTEGGLGEKPGLSGAIPAKFQHAAVPAFKGNCPFLVQGLLEGRQHEWNLK